MLVGCLVDAQVQMQGLMEPAHSLVDAEVQTEEQGTPVQTQVEVEVQTDPGEEMVVQQNDAGAQMMSVDHANVEMQAGANTMDFGMQTLSPHPSLPPSDAPIPPWGDIMSPLSSLSSVVDRVPETTLRHSQRHQN
jgi:hypothetical protein